MSIKTKVNLKSKSAVTEWGSLVGLMDVRDSNIEC